MTQSGKRCTMLKLSHMTPFATGGIRNCFVHPHDSTKCVKPLLPIRPRQSNSVNILKKRKRVSVNRKIKILYRRYIYPRSNYKYSLLRIKFEFAEYRRLEKMHDERVWRHVPRHFGLIETDMGPASVMEMVRNHDGTVAPTLSERIRSGELPEQALTEFRSFLRCLLLPYWSDAHVRNVICARIDAGGRECLFIIDGMECTKLKFMASRLSAAYLRGRALWNYQRFERSLADTIEENKSQSTSTRPIVYSEKANPHVMLKLSHLTPFAAGANRYCFIHPHDPAKCVKPIKPGREEGRTVKFRLFPCPDINELELAEYRRLAKSGSERARRHLPRHFGMIETDMGLASVMELICNDDGSPAPKIKNRIRSGGLPEQALAEFRAALYNFELPRWRDTNMENLLCARIDAAGRERIFIVDGLGLSKRQALRGRLSAGYFRRCARRSCRMFERKLAAVIEEQRYASC